MGSQTPAGNYAYHINDLDQLTSSRINNAVKFQSANFAGLTFGAMYGFSNSTQFAGTPTTTGANGSQGSSSAYSFGANYAQGPFGIGAAYTNIRFPNGAQPAFGVSIANLNTQGLRDLETVGVGARYAIAAALVWANWTHTKFVPLSGETSKLNNYEIGGRYAFTPALSGGLGYTFSKLDGRFDGKWPGQRRARLCVVEAHGRVRERGLPEGVGQQHDQRPRGAGAGRDRLVGVVHRQRGREHAVRHANRPASQVLISVRPFGAFHEDRLV